jgi:hypothetical protein
VDTATRIGQPVEHATELYSAPEFFHASTLSAQTTFDSFSVGLVLFELFAKTNLYTCMGLDEDSVKTLLQIDYPSIDSSIKTAVEHRLAGGEYSKVREVLLKVKNEGGLLRADPLRRDTVQYALKNRGLFNTFATNTKQILLEKIGKQEKQLERIENKLESINQVLHASITTLSLLTKALAHEKIPPRLMWIYPKEKPSGKSKTLFSPNNWFNETLCICFVCPVQGFELKRTKEYWKDKMPYLKAAFTVLKTAIKLGTSIDLPFPDMGLSLESVIGKMDGAVMEVYQAGAEKGEEKLLEVLETRLTSGETDESKRQVSSGPLQSLTERSYASVLGMMEEVGGLQWRDQCGLTPVHCTKDGTYEWVHPSVAKEFEMRGAEVVLR